MGERALITRLRDGANAYGYGTTGPIRHEAADEIENLQRLLIEARAILIERTAELIAIKSKQLGIAAG